MSRRTTYSPSWLQGFTLIELLVVISIIAILLAIMLPVLSSARESAALVQCQTHQRQIAVASATYQHDHKLYFAAGFVHIGPPNYSTVHPWTHQLSPYTQVRTDQASNRISTQTIPLQNNPMNIYRCPTIYRNALPLLRQQAAQYADFTWNGYLGSRSSGANPSDTSQGASQDNLNMADFRMSDRDVYRPSQTLMLMDGVTTDTLVVVQQTNVLGHNLAAMNNYAGGGRGYWHQNLIMKNGAGSMNAAFIDGHVKTYQVKTIKAGWGKLRNAWIDSDSVGYTRNPIRNN